MSWGDVYLAGTRFEICLDPRSKKRHERNETKRKALAVDEWHIRIQGGMGMRVNNGGWILSYGSNHDSFGSFMLYRKYIAGRHGDHWFFRLNNSTKAQASSGGSIYSRVRVTDRSATALFLVSLGIYHHGNADSEAHDSRRSDFHCLPCSFSAKTKKKIKQGKLFCLLLH